MSQENVELLRDMYARPTLAAFAQSLHPQAELRQATAVPDADDYFGREEFVRGTLRWHRNGPSSRTTPNGSSTAASPF